MAITAAELNIVARADTADAEARLSRLQDLIVGTATLSFGKGAFDFVTDFITAGAEFEQRLVLIDQIAGGMGENIDALKAKATELDQTMIFGADEVLAAMEQLARESFTPEQLLDGYTEAALNFAAAVDEDVGASANFFGNVMRVFREEGLEAAEVSDLLTAAVLRSGRPLAEMATGFQYFGGIAASLGIPLEDALTAMTLLSREGIKVRSAGTGLRTLFLELSDPDVRAGLADMGIQVTDLAGNFLPLEEIVAQFGETLDGMSDTDALAFLEGLFGRYASSPLLTLFRRGAEGWEETQAAMEEVPSAAAIMEARMDTLAGALDRLDATWQNLKRTLGDASVWFAQPIVDGVTEIVDAIANAPPVVLSLVATLITATSALAILGGSLRVFSAIGGFGLVTAGLGVMLSQVALLTAGLTALAFVFRDEIGEYVGRAAQTIDDFARRFSVLYDTFRDLQNVDRPVVAFFDALGAAIRATFGIDVTEDLHSFGQAIQGVVQSFDTLFDLGFDEAVGVLAANIQAAFGNETLTSAVVNGVQTVKDLLTGEWESAWENFQDFVSDVSDLTIAGTVTLAGELKELTDDFANWLARKIGLFGGSYENVGSANAPVYAYRPREFSIGEVLLTAALKLADSIWEGAKDFGGWLQREFDEISDKATVKIEQIKVTVLDWAVESVVPIADKALAYVERVLGFGGVGDTSGVAFGGGSIGGSGESAAHRAGVALPTLTVHILSWAVEGASDLYEKALRFVRTVLFPSSSVEGEDVLPVPGGSISLDDLGLADVTIGSSFRDDFNKAVQDKIDVIPVGPFSKEVVLTVDVQTSVGGVGGDDTSGGTGIGGAGSTGGYEEGRDGPWWQKVWDWLIEFRSGVLNALNDPNSTFNVNVREVFNAIGRAIGATIATIILSPYMLYQSISEGISSGGEGGEGGGFDLNESVALMWENFLGPILVPSGSALEGLVSGLAEGLNAVLEEILPASFLQAIGEFSAGDKLYDLIASASELDDLAKSLWDAIIRAVTGNLGGGGSEYVGEGYGIGFEGTKVPGQPFAALGGSIVLSLFNAIISAAGDIDWAHGGGILSKIHDSLVQGITNIDWGSLPGQIASSLWDAVVGWFADNVDIMDLVGAVQDGVAGAGTGSGQRSGTFGGFGYGMSGGGIGGVGFGMPIIGGAGGLANALLQSGVLDQLGAGQKIPAPDFTDYKAALQTLADDGTKHLNALSSAFEQTQDDASASLAGMQQEVATFGNTLVLSAAVAGAGFAAGIKAGADNASADLFGGLAAMTLMVANFTLYPNALVVGDGFASGVRDGARRAVDALFGNLAAMALMTAQFSLYGGGWSIGAGLGAGIADGIAATFGRIAAAAAQAVFVAQASAILAAGIASPSKLMRESVGRWLGEGIAVGIEDRYPRIAAAGAGAVGAIRPPDGRAPAYGHQTNNYYIKATFGTREDWDKKFRDDRRAEDVARARMGQRIRR